jgi:hypothetical protein
MKDSAGDPLQFRLVDLPEGLSFAGEDPAEPGDLALHAAPEEQALHPGGIAIEQRLNRGEAADAQQMALMQAAGLHCVGALTPGAA